MRPVVLAKDGKRVRAEFERPDGRLRVKFFLNFEEERLEFYFHDGVFGLPDDETPTFARHKAELTEFRRWYYGNGQLVITDTETGELIARKDEFFPVNVFPNDEGYKKDLEFWRNIETSRRQVEAKRERDHE